MRGGLPPVRQSNLSRHRYTGPGNEETASRSAVQGQLARCGVSAIGDTLRTGIKPGQRGGRRTKTHGVIDIATLQNLFRTEDISTLTSG